MVILFSFMCLNSPGDWLVSIDLPYAYHSIAMHLSSFLTFLTFEDLGFIPNFKYQLKPVQKLSSWFNLGHLTIMYQFPLKELADVQINCRRALSSQVSITYLSSILGSIEFLDPSSHAADHKSFTVLCYLLFK